MKNITDKIKRFFSLISLFAMILMANQIAFSQLECQPVAGSVNQSGSITTGDPTQTGRVIRDGNPSSCVGKSNGLQNSTAVHYDSYTYTSPVTGCATLSFDHTGCGGAAANTTEVVAYSSYNPAAPATGVIGDAGFSSTGIGSFSFPVTAGQPFTIAVHEITPNGGCASYKFAIDYSTACRQAGFDKTNDGKADVTVWRPENGFWYTINSAGGTNSVQFGLTNDIIAAGDYTGDGATDLGVYRPSNNFWYYGQSQTDPSHIFYGIKYGLNGDVPVPGDYDRDGKTDIAVWRPSDGFWHVLRSSDNTVFSVKWGQSGDVPVIGDFDGDRINDFGVVRRNDPADGSGARWYILESNFNYGFFLSTAFGLASDLLVPGDYDGNGKTDIAVWRPSNGTWYYLKSGVGTNPIDYFQFGQSGDIPQPADYDGDKKTDFAFFRPGAPSIWYIYQSTTSNFTGVQWGLSTDQPATAPYRIQ